MNDSVYTTGALVVAQGHNGTVVFVYTYKGTPCEYNAQQVEISNFILSDMSEISEDGFWEMVEGEQGPNEKQLQAIDNGAIPHDVGIVQTEITELESAEISSPQIEFTSLESQFTGTEEYVAFLGYVLIGVGILDFVLALAGTNITFFLGFLSYFTTIFFIGVGGALIGIKEEIKWFRMDRFSESNVAKGIYAGTVVLALVLVGVLGVMSNYSNADIVGEWYDPIDMIEFQSDGDVVHTTSSDISIIGWRVDGNDLFLEWSDDRGYEYHYKYQISEEFLFVAPYAEADDGTVSGDECWVMSSDKDGENENYWNDVNLSPPEWCNIQNIQ